MSIILRKTLKTLNRIGPSFPAALYHAQAIPFGTPSPPFPVFSFPADPCFTLRIPSLRTRLFCPSIGPLFLSLPAWQLSQTATPLYIHGERVACLRELIPARVFATRFLMADKASVRNVEASDAESLFNFPNTISLARMASGPLLGWMIINGYYSSAFVGLALSGASDWLDGFVARRMNINSVIGSYLDPLADKVLMGCVALSMMKMDLLHPALVSLVVLRDIALVGGAVYKRASNLGWQWRGWYDFMNLNASMPEKVDPIFISKVNTVLQLTLVAAALLQPEFGSDETSTYLTGLSWLVAATTMASWAGYGMLYMRRRPVSHSDTWRSISGGKPS